MNTREQKREFRLLIVFNNRFRSIGMCRCARYLIYFSKFHRTMQRVHSMCHWSIDSVMEFHRHQTNLTPNFRPNFIFHCRKNVQIRLTFVIFSIIVEFTSGQFEFAEFFAFSLTIYPVVFPIAYVKMEKNHQISLVFLKIQCIRFKCDD